MAIVSALLLLFATFSFTEAGVEVKPPAVQLQVCLPQLMSEVAIRVNLRGRGQYCPTTGRVDSPFMAFVRNQVSALDLNPSCSLLDLAVVSCTAVGRRGQRTVARFSANLTCNDPCQEAPDSKRELLNSTTQQRQRLRAAELSTRKIKVSASFQGRQVSIAYSKGGNSSPEEVCQQPASPRQGIATDSDATLCMCPEDCPDTCELPPVTGRCKAAFRRWFHNSISGQCEQFIYGGCGGNENNFMTLEECQQQCSPQPECPEGKEFQSCGSLCSDTCENRLEFSRICPLVCIPGCFCPRGQVELGDRCVARSDCPLEEGSCSLPPQPGPCEGDFPRWFYNSSSEFCQPFAYGGCEGNSNNFPNPFECLEKCRECPAPKVFLGCGTACPETCDNRLEFVRICTLQCVQDCFCPPELVQQGDDCIPASECPIEEGACELPLDTGPCRGAFTRWFYNTSSAQCERFTYGGCQGNDNNFQSLEDCRAKCAAEPQPGECSGGKDFTLCGSACPLTCANMANPPVCLAVCVEGCFCPRGTMEHRGNCLAPQDCPA